MEFDPFETMKQPFNASAQQGTMWRGLGMVEKLHNHDWEQWMKGHSNSHLTYHY